MTITVFLLVRKDIDVNKHQRLRYKLMCNLWNVKDNFMCVYLHFQKFYYIIITCQFLDKYYITLWYEGCVKPNMKNQ